MKYFKSIAKKFIYKDNIGFVELYDASLSNLNDESRIETISTIATLSYGNEQARNPKALYKNLYKWGHLSVFEFIRPPGGAIEESLRNNPKLLTIEELCHNNKCINNYIKLYKETLAIVKIKVPIFVQRQVMRHRCFSYLEMSRRFTAGKKIPFEFYFPDFIHKKERKKLKKFYEKSIKLYNELLKNGIKNEIARTVVPISTYTVFYMMGNLPCWVNFMKYRLNSATQKETRIMAQNIYNLFKKYQYKFYIKLNLLLKEN